MGIPHFTMLQKRANCQLFVTSSAVKGLRTKTPRIVVEIPLYIMLQNLVTTLCARKLFRIYRIKTQGNLLRGIVKWLGAA